MSTISRVYNFVVIFFSVLYKSFQFNITQHIFMILLRSRRLSSVFVRNVFKFNFFLFVNVYVKPF